MNLIEAKEEIRKRVDIVDIIGSRVRLKRTGTNYFGCCPFHNERTPSFCVNPIKQNYFCYGKCQKGGDVYNFLQEYEGMTFIEAVKYLAEKVNVKIDDDYEKNSEYMKNNEILYSLFKDVANYYYKCLFSDEGKVALEYLIKRKVKKETIKKFGLGYAPKSFGNVYALMTEKGYEEKILLMSGLFKKNDKGIYEFFHNRVMFPMVDVQGHVISFQGRVLDDSTPKYIHPTDQDNPIFKKSKSLFAMNFAAKTNRDFIILCEGNMDVISINQAGYENAVASWGTAFSMDQANMIKRKVKKVYLSQDTDEAGIHAIEETDNIFSKLGMTTYVLDYSPCKDADEFISKFGVEKFDELLKNPKTTFLYLISILKKRFNMQDPSEYKNYIYEIVERLKSIEEPLLRNNYIKIVARQEELDLNDLQKSVEYGKINIPTKKYDYKDADTKKTVEFENETEVLLLSILFDIIDIKIHDRVLNKISSYLKVDEFDDNVCKKLYSLFLDNRDMNFVLDELEMDNVDYIEKEKTKKILFYKNTNDVFKSIDIVDRIDVLDTIISLIKKMKIEKIEKCKETDLEKLMKNLNLKNEINNMVIEF